MNAVNAAALMSEEHIWAFDLGKGSIGEAVRKGTQFLHKASLLIPADFAETKTAANRRRMYRTRQAHKKREEWLDKVMRAAGIEVLHGRNYDQGGNWKPGNPADARLEREFAAPGDPTCYTSCLLRIKLLRGDKLESWQVYKALHSAIQRRGYDPNIPWKTRQQRKVLPEASDAEEVDTQNRMVEFERRLCALSKGRPEFHYPCYFDAHEMGLWDGAMGFTHLIDCHARTTRNQIIPRKLVEKEIRDLVDAASHQYPKLKGKADYLLYGPPGTPYASFHAKLRKEFHLKEGGTTDWQGVLGQKIPRFDNRIIGKCVLIPRLNVCKIRKDDAGCIHAASRLAVEVSFLMKLKNMRIQIGGKPVGLTAAQIKSIFENPAFTNFAISESAWKKRVCLPLGAVPLPGHETVEAPRISGRSRFCRPALDILKRLILSGQQPAEFHRAEIARLNGNANPLKGLVETDLNFLLQMGEAWDGIYIPNQKIDALIRSSDNAAAAIRALIGSQNDPIVRHRLNLFAERLTELEQRFGKPETVVLEFVREDFMGPKAKLEYNKFLKQRASERARYRLEAQQAGASERSAGLKLELLRSQGGRCLYTTDPLIPEELDNYVIDHIVPRSKGGPDAVINYVLTTNSANDQKGERTPYQWLGGKPGWDPYVKRVKERAASLRNKKVQLLISQDAEQLVDRYTALAETAWISKLAQGILDLLFGWRNGCDASGRKKVRVVSGGLTARIRRKYRLNTLLNPNAKDEEEAELKNREDDRHHALDAMVISFIPGWTPQKTGFFEFPKGVDKMLFARELGDVVPRNVAFAKPTLEETFYGAREIAGTRFITGREELANLAVKFVKNQRVLKPLGDIEAHRIVDARIRTDIETFLQGNGTLSLEAWDAWCDGYRVGTNGPLVRDVLVKKSKAGHLEEYRDVSSDKSGQYKRGATHQGYFVYDRPSPSKKESSRMQIEVRPVYVFERKDQVRLEIERQAGVAILGYFQSGCGVLTGKAWIFRGKEYPASEYICTSIWSNRNAKLRHPIFGEIGPIGLRILFHAGFRRVTNS